MRSTANDLLNYLGAHLGYSEKPLRSAIALQRTTHYSGDPAQVLGWTVSRHGSEEIFQHEGGKAGYRSAVAFNPGTRCGVVVLTNVRSNYRVGAIAMHLLTGSNLPSAGPAPTPARQVTLHGEVLDAYEGRYQRERGKFFSVIRRGNHLLTDLYGDGGAEFFPVSEDDFVHNDYNDELTFRTDAAGRVTGLLQYPDGRAAETSIWMTRITEDL